MKRPSSGYPRRLRRLVQTAALATAVALLVSTVGRNSIEPAGAFPAITVVQTASADVLWTPDQPLFVLLLGDDRRAGAGCGCADAIHVVGIPAGGGQATMINIPRDSRVNIPGQGTGKINAALPGGGPQRAADTVSGLVGVPISYTFVVGFDALPALVDELGGVTVDVPYDMYDRNAGADFVAGPVVMDGRAALALSRARKAIPGGDFGRTTNQALLIISALGQLRANGVTAGDEIRYLGTMMRHISADGVGVQDMYRLGRLALAIDPANVRSYTMPAGTGTIGGTSYVLPGGEAQALFADFADDAILQSH